MSIATNTENTIIYVNNSGAFFLAVLFFTFGIILIIVFLCIEKCRERKREAVLSLREKSNSTIYDNNNIITVSQLHTTGYAHPFTNTQICGRETTQSKERFD